MQIPTARRSIIDPPEVARLYQETRGRIAGLVTSLDETALSTPVGSCPGWSVRDVVAHLTAVADDWASRRLTGAPTDEQTATHVARFSGRPIAEVLAVWADAAAQLDQMAETAGVEPPLGDIACHEHDIRSAIGRPGARDSGAVWFTSDRLLDSLRTPVQLRVIVEDEQYRSGPLTGPELALRTTRFEALRWRTGRRSRGQLAAMEWSGDPTAVLDHLYMFGPADADIVE
jgi:uncharacterized protein (TIGR03083 family)